MNDVNENALTLMSESELFNWMVQNNTFDYRFYADNFQKQFGTLFYFCCTVRHCDIIQYVLKHRDQLNISFDQKNDLNENILFAFIRNHINKTTLKEIETFQQIISLKEIDIQEINIFKKNCFSYCVYQAALGKILLEHGIDVLEEDWKSICDYNKLEMITTVFLKKKNYVFPSFFMNMILFYQYFI